MGINIGTLELNNCFIGTQQVTRIMLGTTEIWSLGGNLFKATTSSNGITLSMYDIKGIKKWTTTNISGADPDYVQQPQSYAIAGVNESLKQVYLLVTWAGIDGVMLYKISMSNGAISSTQNVGVGEWSKNDPPIISSGRYYQTINTILLTTQVGSDDERKIYTRNLTNNTTAIYDNSYDEEGVIKSSWVGTGIIYTKNNHLFYFKAGLGTTQRRVYEYLVGNTSVLSSVPYADRNEDGRWITFLGGQYGVGGKGGDFTVRFGNIYPELTEQANTYLGTQFNYALQPDNNNILVASYDTINVVDISTKAITSTYEIGEDITNLMMDKNMNIFFTTASGTYSLTYPAALPPNPSWTLLTSDIVEFVSPGNWDSDVKTYNKITV